MTAGRDSWQLEETVTHFSWISLLDHYTYWFSNHNYTDSFGKGVGTLMWVALSLPRISSWAPKQHVLKLWEAFRYHFLLIQNSSTKYQGWISANIFDILMRRISFDCQTSSESLWQPEEHHRVGFIHTTIVPWLWSGAVKFIYFVS